jgi:hypothetical protein
MNVGAAAGRGQVLLFLHRDCGLPEGAFSAIEETLTQERVVCGSFPIPTGAAVAFGVPPHRLK